jgi:hypothetical protein
MDLRFPKDDFLNVKYLFTDPARACTRSYVAIPEVLM